MDDELIGNVLDDRYLITELLGAGAMGRVYLGRHVFLERKAAIKVMSKNMVGDSDALLRFNRTASAASGIISDHIAQIYDFGETDSGLVYLAMEFVPGATLTALIAEGPLEPSRVADLILQAAEGLDAAHDAGIVHRDLKPDNIMVCAHTVTGREVVKLVDFGIAKAISEGASGGVTRTGFVIGTPEFMSPEQLAGVAVDRRTDVYALGLVVFKMLTGTLPFPGSTPEETIFSRLSTAPRTLHEMRASVSWPPALQEVMTRVLARDTAKRYPTAGDFAAALAQAVRRDATPRPAPVPAPLTDSAPPPVERPQPPAWRTPVMVGTAAVLLIAVVALAATKVFSSKSDTTVATNPDTAQNRDSLGKDTAQVVVVDTAGTTKTGGDSARGGPGRGTDPGRSGSSQKGGSDAVAARATLARHYDRLQDIQREVAPEVASSAIIDIRMLLPHLTTREDSVQAKLTQLFAYIHLDQLDSVCGLVRELTALSQGTKYRARVKYFEDNSGCG